MSTNETDSVLNYKLTNSLKFSILVAFEIPSIVVSLMIFVYFAYNRRTLLKGHNISILFLLVINFFQVTTDIPMPIYFFHLDSIVLPATTIYCTWWTWYEFSLNTVNGFLMAWISIERHGYIFHSNYIRNMSIRKRQLFHILPLAACTFWGLFYYLITVVFTPMCQNARYFDSLFCGMPCYLSTTWGTFDLFFDIIFPVVTISVINFALFIRVINQKLMMQGRVHRNWNHQVKMALQLVMISFLYLAVWIPLSIIQLGQIYIDPNFLAAQSDTFNFLVYMVPLLLPMICLMSMPKLIKKFKTFVCRRYTAAVTPINQPAARNNNTSFIPETANRIRLNY